MLESEKPNSTGAHSGTFGYTLNPTPYSLLQSLKPYPHA